jgi:hypothetical protein
MSVDIPPRPQRGIECGMKYLAIAKNEVKVRGDRLDEIWWRGAQWAVTDRGIECLDGTYFIDKARLLEEPDYSWPQHMSGKGWVDIDEFTTAWLVALVLHGYRELPTPVSLRNLFGQLPPRRQKP